MKAGLQNAGSRHVAHRGCILDIKPPTGEWGSFVICFVFCSCLSLTYIYEDHLFRQVP